VSTSVASKADGAPFVIHPREYRGATVLAVNGAVGKDVGAFREQLPSQATETGPVIVDLEGATLLHRAGFQQFMFELQAFSAERRLCVVCRRPSALRLLRSWNVDRLVPIFLTIDGAVGHNPGPTTTGAVVPGSDSSAHMVEFYERDEYLVKSVQQFVAPALRHDDDVVIVVATELHRNLFEAALDATGLDVGRARTAGQYIDLDAEDTLSAFMVEGAPDPARFEATIAGPIGQAVRDGRRVRVYGEMVALLWAAGNVSAVITLEDLWNELVRSLPFLLFCAYPLADFDRDDTTGSFHRICEQHTAVIPTERYSNLEDAGQRARAIAMMQQEAAAALTERRRLEARVRELEKLVSTAPERPS